MWGAGVGRDSIPRERERACGSDCRCCRRCPCVCVCPASFNVSLFLSGRVSPQVNGAPHRAVSLSLAFMTRKQEDREWSAAAAGSWSPDRERESFGAAAAATGSPAATSAACPAGSGRPHSFSLSLPFLHSSFHLDPTLPATAATVSACVPVCVCVCVCDAMHVRRERERHSPLNIIITCKSCSKRERESEGTSRNIPPYLFPSSFLFKKKATQFVHSIRQKYCNRTTCSPYSV